jgi:spermidine/putrescine transport system permease protein
LTSSSERSTVKGWAFSGPALVWTLLFFAAPLVFVLVYSFFRREGATLVTDLSLVNYERALGTDVFRSSWINSVEVSLITVAVSVLLAYPLAYLLAYRFPPQWGIVLLALAVLPFWTSYVVRSYSWLLVLAREGVINRTLTTLGLISEPITIANTRAATVIGFVHFFTMLMTLTIFASLVQIPESYRKAARDLGASGWRTLVYVTFPLSLPGVVVGAFLTFVLAIGDYITPQILGGAQELLLPQAIMLQVQRTADFPMAAALSMLLLVTIVIAYFLSARRYGLVNR